eukprot:scaffold6547_cov144-Skeletonema_menzelii.AAC.5
MERQMSYAAEACIDMEAMCHSPKQCKYHTNDQLIFSFTALYLQVRAAWIVKEEMLVMAVILVTESALPVLVIKLNAVIRTHAKESPRARSVHGS